MLNSAKIGFNRLKIVYVILQSFLYSVYYYHFYVVLTHVAWVCNFAPDCKCAGKICHKTISSHIKYASVQINKLTVLYPVQKNSLYVCISYERCINDSKS